MLMTALIDQIDEYYCKPHAPRVYQLPATNFLNIVSTWSSLHRRPNQPKPRTTSQMLEIFCFEIISMSRKTCSTFFQTYQISFLAYLVANHADLINCHELLCTFLAENVSTRAQGHERNCVGHCDLAAWTNIWLVKRCGFFLFSLVLCEMNVEEGLHL